MTKRRDDRLYVLAISPSAYGVGYALFGGTGLIDWGLRRTPKSKLYNGLQFAAKLIADYQPHVLVLDDPSFGLTRRRFRTRCLIRAVRYLAEKHGIEVQLFPRASLKMLFSRHGATTKHEIARKLVEWLPELAGTLPPKRKPWQPEFPGMAVFDAVALVLAYFDTIEH